MIWPWQPVEKGVCHLGGHWIYLENCMPGGGGQTGQPPFSTGCKLECIQRVDRFFHVV